MVKEGSCLVAPSSARKVISYWPPCTGMQLTTRIVHILSACEKKINEEDQPAQEQALQENRPCEKGSSFV